MADKKEGFKEAMNRAVKEEMEKSENVNDADQKTEQEPLVEASAADVLTTPQVDTDKKTEEESSESKEIGKESTEKVSGVQKKINKMTYEIKQRDEQISVTNAKLEELSKEIAELKKPTQEVKEEPELNFDSVNDLIGYIKDELLPGMTKKQVQEALGEASNKALEDQSNKSKQTDLERFRDSLMEGSGLFEDGGFIGTESQQRDLLKADELYQSNPALYRDIIKDNGIDFLIKLSAGKVAKQKESLDDLLEASEKSKTLKASGDNVVDSDKYKGLSMKDAMRKAMGIN